MEQSNWTTVVARLVEKYFVFIVVVVSLIALWSLGYITIGWVQSIIERLVDKFSINL